MNTLREAAQQALEALEEFCEAGTMLRPIERRDALRAALMSVPDGAEPDDDSLTAAYMMGRYDAKKAEPQEPFGYLYPTGTHPEFRYFQNKRDGVDGMPVYTAPQPHKRLTSEELKRVIRTVPELSGLEDMGWWSVYLCRAIEAAVWGDET